MQDITRNLWWFQQPAGLFKGLCDGKYDVRHPISALIPAAAWGAVKGRDTHFERCQLVVQRQQAG